MVIVILQLVAWEERLPECQDPFSFIFHTSVLVGQISNLNLASGRIKRILDRTQRGKFDKMVSVNESVNC